MTFRVHPSTVAELRIHLESLDKKDIVSIPAGNAGKWIFSQNVAGKTGSHRFFSCFG